MTDPVRRAYFLIQQQRWEMAESELRLSLAQDGQDPEAHGLLAICLTQREQFAEAEAEARIAVGFAPDDGSSFRTLAVVLAERRKYADAEVALEKSIELDPFSVESFSLLARLKYIGNDWKGTLEASEFGLAIDPENIDCNNWRAMALVKLGKRAEAGLTIGEALARDPEDAFTHANQGWALLETGERDRALHHFREALRLEPQMAWARYGIIEALKSKNVIYRLLLKYFLFMSRLSTRTQWAIVIGGFILQRVIGNIAEANPSAAPFCRPLLIAYMSFAILTWLGYPLFNLMLLADKSGRMALTDSQKAGAFSVAGILAVAAGLEAFALYLEFNAHDKLYYLMEWAAFDVAVLSLPTSALFLCAEGSPRRTMLLATIGVGLVGLIPLGVYILAKVAPTAPAGPLVSALRFCSELYVFGIIGLQFLAMKLVGTIPER